MHIHRYEKIWMIFGISMLFVFLIILGVGAFAQGMHPPSHRHGIHPEQVNETPPFDNPGLKQVGDKEYEAVMTSFTFGYSGGEFEIPAGSTVHFTLTSTDVVHGFQIPGTAVNTMVIPGEISKISHTFKKPGEYLILCNEYCGAAHEIMKTTFVVK